MIVDSQIHLWAPETPDRPWIPGGQQRAHLPEPLTYQKFLLMMDEAGVDRAIIVPPTWPGDNNDHALEAAARHPDRFAIMGRFPVERADMARLLPGWKEPEGHARHSRRVQSREGALDRRWHRRLVLVGGAGARYPADDLRAGLAG